MKIHLKIFNIILFFLLVYTNYVYSQDSHTSWINYNQQYYKIQLSQDGLYRIPYANLLQAGIPVDNIDPRWIQIFFQGQEQYIYIHNEGTSGIFDPNSYIEFYGKRNKSKLDLGFYDDPDNCVNPDYSMHSDTSAYFLTWNTSINNKRFKNVSQNNFEDYSVHAQEYCYKNIRNNYTSAFYWGSTQNLFSKGEGWFDNAVINEETPRIKNINIPNFYSGNIDTYFEIAVAGVPASAVSSSVPHHLKLEFLDEIRIDETYTGYEFVRKNIVLKSSLLTNNISFKFTSNDITQTNIADRNAVSYINIKYPHTWNFENQNYFEFYLPKNNSAEKDYLEITNFNTSSAVILYDLTNYERISLINDESILKTLVNYSDTERFLALTNKTGVKSVDKISKIGNGNKFIDYETQIKNANFIIITHSSLWAAAQEYANYRSSTGYDIALIDIDQLYNQYAWGVNKHPAAIRNFLKTLFDYSDMERYVFLIGKSIHTRTIRNSPANYKECLVPSAGNPSSDNIFTLNFKDNNYYPIYPIGRLAAYNQDNVKEYLKKIMQYESAPTEEWMKTVLHFGGGMNVNEQSAFAGYLNNYKNIIEDTLFGGKVSTFLKNSSEPIQITQSDSITNLINNGATILTFFGHAHAGGFDQNIDLPQNYNNTGKYPFIIANSCFAGDIHLRDQGSISEIWINEKQKGAIAFLASIGDGIASYLNIYSTELYKNIAYKDYNKPLGLQIKNTIKNIIENYPQNTYLEVTCHETALHGDPALVINSHEKPDLTITADLIKFNPQEITTLVDSFELRIVIKNIGKATSNTFLLSINRTLPNGSVSEYNIPIYGCNYKDTVYINLLVNRLVGPGLNKLHLFVDSGNQIDELNENNNQVNINFLIKTADLFPIYPYNYSIIPSKNASLIASTGDPFLSSINYLFQIDSTDLFNSPILQTKTINSSGGIVKWDLPFELVENRVYFWRIAHEHANSDSVFWKESSFVYIEGEEGWSQAHFFQYKENDFLFLDYDRPARKLKYVNYPKKLHCHNQGNYAENGFTIVRWTLDNSYNNGLGANGNCGTADAILVVVIDPETILAWPSDYQHFGHRNYPKCFSSAQENYYFSFSTDQVSLDSMNNMINNYVPDAHYLLIYSWGNGNFSNWPTQLKQTFYDLGSLQIDNVADGNPYIFFTKKGTISSTTETYGTFPLAKIDLYVDLYRDFDNGNMKSVKIGPAAEWKSFNWEYFSLENPEQDSVNIKVFGIDNFGNETQVMSPINPDNFEIFQLQDSINYQEFPNLKLEFYSKDEINKTSAQLEKWQLKFKGVPETAIDPKFGFYFCCDTIQEGDDFKFSIATKNISDLDMDSLDVIYWVQNADNETIHTKRKKLRPHPAQDILIDTFSYSSLGMKGMYSVWVEFNPINPQTGIYYQAEQHHFNNIANKYFFVQNDNINPLLDVSFDGRYIMNGEIISAKPEILIKLKDENKYLALNDTSLFRIYISELNTGVEKRIYFGLQENPEESIEWTPAILPDNSCEILYKPIFKNDGIYKLRVQAVDVSGNESGKNDYIIEFEIVNKPTITHLLNYPNPFSSSTRFVFELTGSEIPDELRIDIFTITGTLVKTIFLEEFGSIRIGKNISEYAWDGKDMYGDQLANGVYFYQVSIKLNGKDIELRNTEADKYFKKEIGKMYLLR
ncbi:MAG: hypothetical protein GX793_08115 [Bacteroidales bacterium]|jgi:hypothetical protein|nr:C25 family cysteine peptidase [Bacteroidales bacterium]MCK9498543.1 C25 family cysteine peptidase [Bacteroidales bacterium]NLB86979.1 hypothetical protein [Bacteroidales bacterium]NLB87008.1 hypothetical protein [Bacteroidales bacterium]